MYTELKDVGELVIGCKLMLECDLPECSKIVFNDLFAIQVRCFTITVIVDSLIPSVPFDFDVSKNSDNRLAVQQS